ncbi:MAG: type I glutamate--ammonia ligase [Pseudomonadota bacterium]
MSTKTLRLIHDNDATWVDLRFTDTLGKEHHVSIPSRHIDANFFAHGKPFDGSSISGWKSIHESDMILMPIDEASIIDPFTDEPTVIIRCNSVEPNSHNAYNRDPRSIAQRAEAYLTSSGIGDSALFGPEPEFFVFDDARWRNDMSGASYCVSSDEAAWSSDTAYDDGNMGHRPRVKGGYFPVPPVDALHDLRSAMSAAMSQMGLDVEVHHHEVGTAGQCEIGCAANTLTAKADEVQVFKYCTHNVAHAYGKTATFMPKPLVGDNGSGMHCHQSIIKNGHNIFKGDIYAGLSQEALWYIGGIIQHAHAINAFTNPSTNSYKRLVPGYEAPVMLAYSARNRSASIRIPFVHNPNAARIEVRFPDPSANPYLAFTAQLMAGLDGIHNKIDPGTAADHDLYHPTQSQDNNTPKVASSLEQALDALDTDRAFLIEGGVMDNDMIDAYIALKRDDVTRLQKATHPLEFDMYYSC